MSYALVSLPELDQLYSENEPSADLIETKWKILKWIMSFIENEIPTIRKMKKEFRMIAAILCALIKVKIPKPYLLKNVTSNTYLNEIPSDFIRKGKLAQCKGSRWHSMYGI